MIRAVVKWVVIIVAASVVIIQLVPYGRDHTNPLVRAEPAWDSQQTRALTARACYDCHSNETVWLWYTSIAPVSWLIQSDVDRGRAKVNFSEWDGPQEEADDSTETVQEGEMPPWYYVVAQPKARLSPPELQALVQGLAASVGTGEGNDD